MCLDNLVLLGVFVCCCSLLSFPLKFSVKEQLFEVLLSVVR